jgi:hypothetical protein
MRPLRIPAVQITLSWLLTQWLRLCFATIRWRRENEVVAERIWEAGGGVICVFWHSRVAVSPVSWPHGRAQVTRALISLSADGQFIARTMGRLGFPGIRGSSAKPGAPGAAKGGSAAFREALRQLKVGGVAVTPDGPRGPNRTMGEGLPLLAKMSGAPVLFIGVSCAPCIRLGSWDRAMVPLPFGRGAVVWDMATFPEGGDPAAVALDWTARQNAVEDRSEALARERP